MEPRRHRRGDIAIRFTNPRFRAASMEPRRHRRGDGSRPVAVGEISALLQWSHDVTVVEI